MMPGSISGVRHENGNPHRPSYFNTSQGAFARLKADGSANHAPSTQSLSVTVTANQFSEIPLAGSDPDGDAVTTVILTNPSHGQLRWNGNQVLYMPTAGYTGSDSLRYAMSDGLLTGTPETVNITVNPASNILEWEFGSPATNVPQDLNSTANAVGILPGSVVAGAYSSVSMVNLFQDDAIAMVGLPIGALNSTAYLEWTVAPSTNREFSLDRLSFGVWNYDPSRPVAFQLRWSEDGFATSQTLPVGSSTEFGYVGNYYGPSTGKPFGVTLSGVSALQNRTRPVACRLYYWHPTAGFSSYTGIGKLGTTQSDLIVSGTVVPLRFETWASELSWNGQDSSPEVDPDGDRISNRMEFLLGRNPVSADLPYSQLAVAGDGQGNNCLTLDYRRRSVVNGPIVQTSTDLTQWTNRTVDGNQLVEEIVNANPLGDGTVEDVRLKFLLTPSNSKEFLRLVAP